MPLSLTERLAHSAAGSSFSALSNASTSGSQSQSLTPRGSVEPDADSACGFSSSSIDPGLVSTGPSQVLGRRRRNSTNTETAIAEARRVARKARLSPVSTEALLDFAQLSEQQQRLQTYAHSLKLEELIIRIQPAETPFEIKDGSELKAQIKKHTRLAMLCPSISGYLKEPLRIVQETIRQHPEWGANTLIQNSPRDWKIVSTHVRDRLTYERKEYKAQIKLSLGTKDPSDPDGPRIGSMDIVTLVKAAASLKDIDLRQTNGLVLTLQICARFAFLRQVFHETNGVKMWDKVDKQLQETHIYFSTRARSQSKMSHFFLEVLQEDMKVYGRPEHLGHLQTARASEEQKGVDAIVNGNQSAKSNQELYVADHDEELEVELGDDE